MATAKYDWDSIAREYQQGFTTTTDLGKKHIFPTLEDLAEKYGCAVDTLKGRSAREDWTLKRELYRTKIRERLDEKNLSELFSQSSEYDAKNLHKISQIHQLLDGYMRQYMPDPQSGIIEFNDESPRVNIRELEGVSRLLKESHSLARAIIGEPTSSQNLEREIAEKEHDDILSDPEAKKARLNKLESQVLARAKRKEELKKLIGEKRAKLAELSE